LNKILKPILKIFIAGFFILCSVISFVQENKSFPVLAEENACANFGWFPKDFGLKDHSIFYFDGYYYLIANYVPGEQYFAYARSLDMCSWENLNPVLDERSDPWDTHAVWAPFVYYDDGLYYMYYTGIKGPYPDLTQSIMLATSSNPADPNSWVQQGMIFQPDHDHMIWEDHTWADCRDPMVFKVGDTYYLYYTGRDEAGGIIGLATASSPEGPWFDWGATMILEEAQIPESPTIFIYDGVYYLFYSNQGGHYRIGASPNGPWLEEIPFNPGWAHEVWTGQDNLTYTSYLTNYSVTISQLIWDDAYYPPRPFIGSAIFHTFLPLQTH
jgi:hypothetical protein